MSQEDREGKVREKDLVGSGSFKIFSKEKIKKFKEMKKFWVYIHTCPNGKKYVGITTASKPERRWREGKGYWYNKHFYSTILKYGWDNITHEVFEVESEEEMYRKEVELISFYHSNDPEYGYNNSTGGEHSSLGCKHSEETRRKISEAGKRVQKKVHSDPEYRRKMSEVQKKVHSDPEYLRKQSEAQKKVHSDPEYKKKMSEAVKKSLSDPEVRRKMSEVQKKVHSDPEYRKKMSETMKGRVFSEEHREHLAESNRRKAKDPEYRKKLSEACKKGWSDPEVRKKMSETCKKKWLDHPELRKKQSEVAKNRPRIKIQLPDGTLVEITKQNLTKCYINKGKEFEYVS